MYALRVKNRSVWQSLRVIFISSALLFLINIYFGFDNTLAVGELPRWQRLIHLHAGSIGWITLSAIGLAVWLLTGDREVSRSYERTVRVLAWSSVIIFAGYIPNFWLAFSRGQSPLLALLPVFGSLSVVVLWAAAVFALVQLRRQPVMATIHILASGALLVAAVGATVGALLGLERVIGRFLPLPEMDRVGAHAGMMDTYLFLVASAIVEWFVGSEAGQRWTWSGLVQAIVWTIGAILVPVAFFLNMVEQLLPIFGMLLILGLVIFLIRIAWRALRVGPLAQGVKPWAFFGSFWLILYMGLFLYGVVGTGGDFSSLPSWFGAVFAHSAFVGMMTNLILGLHALRGQDSAETLPWGEPVAMWLINLGLIVFFALKIVADIRLGAALMGLGVLLGVGTTLLRLRTSEVESGLTEVEASAISAD